MSESTKWWKDEKSREEVVEWLAGLTADEELESDVNISMGQFGRLFFLKDDPNFQQAAKLYVEIVLFNYIFDQVPATEAHKLFAAKDERNVSCRNIPSYAKRVGNFAKVLSKLNVETKEEIQDFLKLTKAYVHLDCPNEKSPFSNSNMEKLNLQIYKEINKDMKALNGKPVDKVDEKLKNL